MAGAKGPAKTRTRAAPKDAKRAAGVAPRAYIAGLRHQPDRLHGFIGVVMRSSIGVMDACRGYVKRQVGVLLMPVTMMLLIPMVVMRH